MFLVLALSFFRTGSTDVSESIDAVMHESTVELCFIRVFVVVCINTRIFLLLIVLHSLSRKYFIVGPRYGSYMYGAAVPAGMQPGSEFGPDFRHRVSDSHSC